MNRRLQRHPVCAILLPVFGFLLLMLLGKHLLRDLPSAEHRILCALPALFGLALSAESFVLSVRSRLLKGGRTTSVLAGILCAALFAAALCVFLPCFVTEKWAELLSSLSSAILLFCLSVFLSAALWVLPMRRAALTEDQKTLLVLGCAVKNGTVSRELSRRLDRAAFLFKNHASPLRLLLCGGDTGKTGSAEAAAMKAYLSAKGIPEQAITVEDRSMTTEENFRNAKALLAGADLRTAVFLTSDYHVLRSALSAASVGFPLPGIGCRTPLIHLPRALLRETIAWFRKLLPQLSLAAALFAVLFTLH